MTEEWPEGRTADPEAARRRYDEDAAKARGELRRGLRADLSDAHIGAGVVVCATGLAWAVGGPAAAAPVPAGFAGLYLVALGMAAALGARGRTLLRRAYLVTFGWGGWIS